MSISVFDGPVAHLYNEAIELLREGDVVTSADFPNAGQYSLGVSRMNSVLAHLASPSSAAVRLESGLTVARNNRMHGVVLRVRRGEYKWFPYMELHNQTTVYTNDPAMMKHNLKWSWRRVPEPAVPQPNVVSTLTPNTEGQPLNGARVAIKGDTIVVVHDNGVVIAEIIDELGFT